MSEKKVINQVNEIPLLTLRMVLGEYSCPNPKRDQQFSGLKISKPGPEMEGIVTKLITHFKEQQK